MLGISGTQAVMRLAFIGLLAGVLVLPVSLAGDLAVHSASGHAAPDHAQTTCLGHSAPMHADEASNPWHYGIVAGEALVLFGLGSLYLGERARRLQLQARSHSASLI